MLWFNDLFMTSKNVADIANEEKVTGQNQFLSTRNVAYDMALNDVRANMKDFSFNEIMEFHRVGEVLPGEYEGLSANERGVELKMIEPCEMSFWTIDCLTLCKETEGAVDVLIYADNILVETLNFEGTYEGTITLTGRKILIVTTNVNPCIADNVNENTCECTCANMYDNMIVRGYNDGVYTSKTYGFTFNASLRCGLESLICNEKSFAYLLAFKTYVLLLENAIRTDKYSQFIVGSKENFKSELAKYDIGYTQEGKPIPGRYSAQLDTVVKILEVKLKDTDCNCVENAAPIMRKSWN